MEYLCRFEFPYVRKHPGGGYEQGMVKPVQCSPEPEPRDAKGRLVSRVRARRETKKNLWKLGEQSVIVLGKGSK